jgi:hypothetical protein
MGGKYRPAGLIVGLLGCGLTGYALFSVLASAGCIGALSKTCADGGFSTVWMLPVGIVAAVVGIFLGGGALVFSGLFMAIGAGALAVGFMGLMPMMPVFPWLFGGIFFASGFLPLGLALVGRRMGAAKMAMAEDLYRTGVKGIGTITDVRDTGITINNNPRIVITMRIEPMDNSTPVERQKTVTVSRVQVPRPGERYPAWFDRNDPEKWMYGTDMDATAPAEVKEMFARARSGGGGIGSAAAAAEPDNGADSGPVAELASLTELWKGGALTDDEFAAAKARLLARIGR